MTLSPAILEQLRAKVRGVLAEPDSIGVLSFGEQLAVALVLDRYDWLGDYGMLDAVDRIGPEWFTAALYLKRHGFG
jgi:hypothetical protein